MRFLMLPIVPLLASALLLTTPALHRATVQAALTAQDTKPSDTTGYPTGTTCPKTGTYRASNKYTEIVLVVTKGKAFPPFSDGTKTVWYPLKDSPKN